MSASGTGPGTHPASDGRLGRCMLSRTHLGHYSRRPIRRFRMRSVTATEQEEVCMSVESSAPPAADAAQQDEQSATRTRSPERMRPIPRAKAGCSAADTRAHRWVAAGQRPVHQQEPASSTDTFPITLAPETMGDENFRHASGARAAEARGARDSWGDRRRRHRLPLRARSLLLGGLKPMSACSTPTAAPPPPPQAVPLPPVCCARLVVATHERAGRLGTSGGSLPAAGEPGQ